MKTKVGYEIGSGSQIDVETSHMMVTGVTALSGKTTTLEVMLQRSNVKAIVFRTKLGEKAFQDGNFIDPYFKDRSDWEFVESLIEAITKTKVRFFEHAMILRLCQESHDSLFDLKKLIDNKLAGETGETGKKKKVSRFDSDILLSLQAYLDKALPKLKNIPFTDKLELKDGLNIINLENFHDDDAVLSLIISSVVEEVLERKNTITVIPEAWKFIPERRNTPCKLAVERLIRQGATNNNFVWIDSQDIAEVAKSVIKQISVYLLGYQSEPNEVKHTINTIPLPKNQKPKTDDIMNLGKGQFYLATRDLKAKVYVQPTWLSDQDAKGIATGELKVSDFKDTRTKKTLPKQSVPKPTPEPEPEPVPEPQPEPEPVIQHEKLSDDTLTYVDKLVGEVQRRLDEVETKLKEKPTRDEVVKEIVAMMPTISSGTAVYKIAPLQAIQKKFLEEAKVKITADIKTLNHDEKKLLQYLELKKKGIKRIELLQKCFYLATGGQNYDKMVAHGKKLEEIQVGEFDSHHGIFYGRLMKRIESIVGNHDATKEEMQSLYNHILMELLGEKIEVK